jgi:hypothetical protein
VQADRRGWVVTVQAEFFGGFHLFQLWEVADIAFLVTIRYKRRIRRVKIGLLQSKRLYSKERKSAGKYPVPAIDRLFYLQRDPNQADLWGAFRTFYFDEQSKYLAIRHKEQIEAMTVFQKRSKIPISYLLYNPWDIPFSARVPQTVSASFGSAPPLGVRVMPSEPVMRYLISVNQNPSFKELKAVFKGLSPREKFGYESEPGWRLETWVTDLLLACKLGYTARNYLDEDIRSNLFGRTAPISAAVSIAISAPFDLPDNL